MLVVILETDSDKVHLFYLFLDLHMSQSDDFLKIKTRDLQIVADYL